jgi:hypothetical protein
MVIADYQAVHNPANPLDSLELISIGGMMRLRCKEATAMGT